MNKCWICGKPGEKHREIGERDSWGLLLPYNEESQRCYCSECFKQVMEQFNHDQKEYVRLKKKMMFERAIRLFEKQNLHIYDYEEAIKAVEEFVNEKPDKVDSAYEVIAAIILVHNRIPCKLQHKVGKYQCDFCIPSMRVILEIDGERHKSRRLYDSMRDNDIRAELGSTWEVVHISTDCLDMQAVKLLEAIETVLEERKKKRQKTTGTRNR